jgi:probable HAF family extracellular repeat protein
MLHILGRVNLFSVHTRVSAADKRRGQVRLRPFLEVLEGRALMASIIDLGAGTGVTDINNSGQIVGGEGGASGHAFLYSNGAMTDLGTLPGGTESFAEGINDPGQVVGHSNIANGLYHAFLYSNGAMTDLGTLPGKNQSSASGINDSGQVVGESDTSGDLFRAFLYSAGVMTDLGALPGGNESQAHGINNSGQVVGISDIAPGVFPSYGFLYSNGGMTNLGNVNPIAINNVGQIVGNAGNRHGFLYSNGVTTDLGTLPGDSASAAVAINDSGQIVGYSYIYQGGVGNAHAFLHSGGKLIDLNTLLPSNSGWTLQEATAINNQGQIIGFGAYQNPANLHSFLLTLNSPTPNVALVSAPNPSTYGQSVTFTATVSPASSGQPTPTGTVTFEDGSTNLGSGQLNASGIATFTTSTLAVGTHSITAVYGGDGNFSSNTSSPITQTVNPEATGTVTIQVNNTTDQTQKITLFNPPSTGEAFTQTIPAKITNTGTTTGTFQLSVQPSSAAVLLDSSGNPITSVSLPAGDSTEVTISPTADSSAPNDVHIIATQGGSQVGEDSMTIVSVLIPKDIRNADTPADMVDRIPPFGPAATSITPISVVVSPNLAGSGQAVTLSFLNQSDNNGFAAFENGAQSDTITSTGTVNLTGLQQTAATGFFIPLGSLSTLSIPVNVGEYASQLMLAVDVRGQETIASNGFSVAAIPLNLVISKPRTYTADRFHKGMVVDYGWESDSGNIADLDAVDMTEVVKTVEATGRLWFAPLDTSTWSNAAGFRPGVYYDSHTVPVVFIRPDESSEQDQAFEFRDTRTGANYMAMPNSGFIIRQDIYENKHTHKLFLTTTKAGAPVTVSGITTDAGLTSPTPFLTITQRVRRLF